MFSRYKKVSATEVETKAPAATPAPEVKAKTPAPSAKAPVDTAPSPAEVQAADKAQKRKERLATIRLMLHKHLLEELNLAALENAKERELRQEIS